jgi:hypothetical protein
VSLITGKKVKIHTSQGGVILVFPLLITGINKHRELSFANFVIKIKDISTEFVKDLLLKCAYFT